MNRVKFVSSLLFLAVALLASANPAAAGVQNVKVVTDASPDYTDIPSMIRSITGKWTTDEEKLWALYYWNHIGRRQTTPMNVHGLDSSDPIRQFNDYGYMMCSTIAGALCGTWHNMGYEVKYYDLAGHTVPEVLYGGRWHMYDDSMSALFTLCDGKTIAGAADIAKEGVCELSGGKKEPCHVARYHCLYATSANGWLTGADCPRDLKGYGGAFNRPAYRDYYREWDWGHRYVLNLRDNEVYTRFYQRLDAAMGNATTRPDAYGFDAHYYVPNPTIPDASKDPESANARFSIRGNGRWEWRPDLSADQWAKAVYSSANIASEGGALHPAKAGEPATVTFRVSSANVTASQLIHAVMSRKTEQDEARVSVSINNGVKWLPVWQADKVGELEAKIDLLKEVGGAYEVLVRFEMLAKQSPADVSFKGLIIRTITQVNSKTQPQLTLGTNRVYVGAGEPTEAVVLWPELQGEAYKADAIEFKNVLTDKKHEGWHSVIRSETPGEDSYLVYRVDAPRDIVGFTYGGRLYNRNANSHIDFLYSLDGGKTWTKTYRLDNNTKPWDVIQFDTVDKVPNGTRWVLFKYLWNDPTKDKLANGLYAARMEVRYQPAETTPQPIEVTFRWKERYGQEWGKDLISRSHTQRVEKLPATYEIHVGGDDLPMAESLQVNLAGARQAVATQPAEVKLGYGEAGDPAATQPAAAKKFERRWVTMGKNLAVGKKYDSDIPSVAEYGANPDKDKTILTDGIVGTNFMWMWGAGTMWRKPVEITLDLGEKATFGPVGLHFTEMGELLRNNLAAKNKIEILLSDDGKEYRSAGFVDMTIRLKDVPANYMLPDDEQFGGWSFYLTPEKPLTARYVRYKVQHPDFFCPTELLVREFIKYEPFDLKIALPCDALPTRN